MASPRGKRRLTTIFAADVEGYSRLMHVDEEATLATLTTYREIIDGLIARHDGRIFGTGGDSVLAEFGSRDHFQNLRRVFDHHRSPLALRKITEGSISLMLAHPVRIMAFCNSSRFSLR